MSSTRTAASARTGACPGELLGGLDGDEAARGVIEEQDREIAAKSGLPPLRIKSLKRSGKK